MIDKILMGIGIALGVIAASLLVFVLIMLVI